jgi:hypothetical protein
VLEPQLARVISGLRTPPVCLSDRHAKGPEMTLKLREVGPHTGHHRMVLYLRARPRAGLNSRPHPRPLLLSMPIARRAPARNSRRFCESRPYIHAQPNRYISPRTGLPARNSPSSNAADWTSVLAPAPPAPAADHRQHPRLDSGLDSQSTCASVIRDLTAPPHRCRALPLCTLARF